MGQQRLQFGKGDVWRRLVRSQDQIRMRLEPCRPAIATLLLQLWHPVVSLKLLPPDRTRRTHTKPHRCLPPRQTTLDHSDDSVPKIHRQCSSHPCQPPSPARIVNQKPEALGIPRDSIG